MKHTHDPVDISRDVESVSATILKWFDADIVAIVMLQAEQGEATSVVMREMADEQHKARMAAKLRAIALELEGNDGT